MASVSASNLYHSRGIWYIARRQCIGHSRRSCVQHTINYRIATTSATERPTQTTTTLAVYRSLRQKANNLSDLTVNTNPYITCTGDKDETPVSAILHSPFVSEFIHVVGNLFFVDVLCPLAAQWSTLLARKLNEYNYSTSL